MSLHSSKQNICSLARRCALCPACSPTCSPCAAATSAPTPSREGFLWGVLQILNQRLIAATEMVAPIC